MTRGAAGVSRRAHAHCFTDGRQDGDVLVAAFIFAAAKAVAAPGDIHVGTCPLRARTSVGTFDCCAVRTVHPVTGWPKSGRERLLESGVDLLEAADVRVLLRSITARSVAKRAGLTTGAFYGYWETQEAFIVDVVARVLEPRSTVTLGVTDVEARVVTDRTMAPSVVLRRVARAALERELSRPMRGFFTLLARCDDRIVAAPMRDLFAVEEAALVAFHRELFGAVGLEPRAPLTWEELTVVLVASLTGATVRHAADPGTYPLRLHEDTTVALLCGLLQPVGGGGTVAELEAVYDTMTDRRT
jgi:AcrR family transcriptional regulator